MAAARRWRRMVLAALAALLLPPAAFFTHNRWTSNFGTVVPGRVFRSAQMSPTVLRAAAAEHGIKTVLNLRGPNPAHAWYRDERAATVASGATQVDVAMSSCQWMSRAQLRAVVGILDTCEYPLLIHCEFGAERTGLVAAVSELLRPGATLDDAERQFTIRHGFLPVRDGPVMLGHLRQYEDWLRRRGLAHAADRFREWVETGFSPQSPSREQWPYDPYPLVVVTRPNQTPDVPPLARQPADSPARR